MGEVAYNVDDIQKELMPGRYCLESSWKLADGVQAEMMVRAKYNETKDPAPIKLGTAEKVSASRFLGNFGGESNPTHKAFLVDQPLVKGQFALVQNKNAKESKGQFSVKTNKNKRFDKIDAMAAAEAILKTNGVCCVQYWGGQRPNKGEGLPHGRKSHMQIFPNFTANFPFASAIKNGVGKVPGLDSKHALVPVNAEKWDAKSPDAFEKLGKNALFFDAHKFAKAQLQRAGCRFNDYNLIFTSTWMLMVPIARDFNVTKGCIVEDRELRKLLWKIVPPLEPSCFLGKVVLPYLDDKIMPQTDCKADTLVASVGVTVVTKNVAEGDITLGTIFAAQGKVKGKGWSDNVITTGKGKGKGKGGFPEFNEAAVVAKLIKYDTNNSDPHALNKWEFRQYLDDNESDNKVTLKELNELFKKADGDGWMAITVPDIIKFEKQRHEDAKAVYEKEQSGFDEEAIKAKLIKYDTNNSNPPALNKWEFRKYLDDNDENNKVTLDELNAMFKDADRDGWMAITIEDILIWERKRYQKSLEEEVKPPAPPAPPVEPPVFDVPAIKAKLLKYDTNNSNPPALNMWEFRKYLDDNDENNTVTTADLKAMFVDADRDGWKAITMEDLIYWERKRYEKARDEYKKSCPACPPPFDSDRVKTKLIKYDTNNSVPPALNKWEFRKYLDDNDTGNKVTLPELNAMFKEADRDGWRAITIDDLIIWEKKRYDEAIEKYNEFMRKPVIVKKGEVITTEETKKVLQINIKLFENPFMCIDLWGFGGKHEGVEGEKIEEDDDKSVASENSDEEEVDEDAPSPASITTAPSANSINSGYPTRIAREGAMG